LNAKFAIQNKLYCFEEAEERIGLVDETGNDSAKTQVKKATHKNTIGAEMKMQPTVMIYTYRKEEEEENENFAERNARKSVRTTKI
jgi:hypothetical protein